MLCADGCEPGVVAGMRPGGALLRAALAAGLLSWSFGCQSTRSWSQGCPGVYSGVKYYRDQVAELPFDGKVFFSFDLPLTVVVDTLALPFTAFAKRPEPRGGFAPGCRWAAPR
jgi:uncharacterized protein YceK